jgi:hypothetical protein
VVGAPLREQLHELIQALQVVCRHEVMHMRAQCAHAGGQRLKALPLPSTRRAQRRLNSCKAAVSRVPPDQSSTWRVISPTARSESRLASRRVMRVSRVPKTKLSTRAGPCDKAWARCSSMRE